MILNRIQGITVRPSLLGVGEVESSRPKEEKGKEVEEEIEIGVKKEEPKGVPKSKGISFPNNPPIISPPSLFP